MSPPASATVPARRRNGDLAHRAPRPGRTGTSAATARTSLWQETLTRLEERETEARRRMEEAREELQRVRVDNDRLSATVVAREAALVEGDRREAELREALRARESEAIQARAEVLSVAQSIDEHRAQVVALTGERDAALKRARTASKKADLYDTRLRSANKQLKSRRAEIAKLERKLADQDRKMVTLRQRSDRLSELRQSRAFKFMTLVWRVKGLFRLRRR